MNVDRYALFGNPVAHSQSPFIHRYFAKLTQQLIDYQAVLVAPEQFTSTVHHFFAEGGQGCNITQPFKEAAYPLCVLRTERARAAEAVNTIIYTANGLLGDNTDGVGLVNDICEKLAIRDKRILLLGAGGAARGVLLTLISEQPASITISNRTLSKAATLAEVFSHYEVLLQCIALDQLNESYDIIINATSASLQQQLLPLPDSLFQHALLSYDMMYGTQPSPFLQQAARCGCFHTMDGLGMLVRQAAEAFYCWRGVYPAVEPVFSALQNKLKDNS